MERFIFFVLIFAVVVGLAAPNGHSSQAQLNQQILVDANASASAASGSADETAMSPAYGGETELQRGPGGHFYTAASINGQSLPFVVDTGATSVALTVDAARAAGIYIDPSSFTVVGTGASGATRGTRVTISHLEVAGRTVDNVDAVVLEGLEINLLGQSVLSRFGSIEMKGDRMMLR
ncbi:retropepsin-like aspartic protease family protein [Sphingomonas sp. RB1R13]|uniref:retropepsin-like aspartic protease family protein n=1 Tax=Sphingomonas sp. RB1R13 TaxID=3096159 RepID=UPI002FCC0112